MSKHTALPWVATKKHARHKLCVRGGVTEGWPEGGTTIFETKEHRNGAKRGEPITHWGWSEEEEANAEFVVRACNAHYELLEALKGMVKFAEHVNDTSNEGGLLDERFYAALDAIKKAEGQA